MSIIKIRDLSKTFRKSLFSNANNSTALDNISLDIKKGEMLAILGVSGSGKSTLLNVIDLLLTPDSGLYEFDGIDTRNLSDKERAVFRNKHMGYVLQDFGLIESDTVSTNIELPLRLAGINRKERSTRILESLKLVGILDLKDKYVYQLSGGQKQRVAIARAIVMNPEVILADEPTGALDSKTKIDIAELFSELWKAGKTVIIVTHDSEIASYCSRVINIKDGKIV